MCTLIALWRAVEGYDLVVGMNRDESTSRPADPPALVPGDPILVAPRDRTAGGTWIGASEHGLVVALSNRRGRTIVSPRSRGLLALDALRAPRVAAVEVFLEREVREHAYNFWNLLAMSREEIRFFRYDGRISTNRGHEGLNVLTNEGGNVVTDPRTLAVQDAISKSPIRAIPDAVRGLQGTLRRHASPGGTGLCVHATGGGTVSSTILALSNADPGENVLLHSDGPPCSTPYRDYHEIIRRLPGPD